MSSRGDKIAEWIGTAIYYGRKGAFWQWLAYAAYGGVQTMSDHERGYVLAALIFGAFAALKFYLLEKRINALSEAVARLNENRRR